MFRLVVKNGLFNRQLRPLLLLLMMVFAVASTAPAEATRIRSFVADLNLHKDGLLDVVETIKVDFGHEHRHGIYRIIPITYNRNLGRYSLLFHLDDVEAATKDLSAYQFSNVGTSASIKIGNPNKTVSGSQVYKIHYHVRREINTFGHDQELYWNVTGNEWPFPLDHVIAKIHLPPGIEYGAVKTISFSGPLGSKKPASEKKTGDTLEFETSGLLPGEGLTLAVRMPKGSLKLPTAWDEFVWFMNDWYEAVALPAVTAVLLYIYWYFNGRDPGGSKPVGVEWEPPKDLTPAEVGTLIDESCDLPDITSTILDLAARGYLTIEQVPYDGIMIMSDKDYIFKKVAEPSDGKGGLKPHESILFNAMFSQGTKGTSLSGLAGHFYSYIDDIRETIYGSLLKDKYFARDPKADRDIFYSISKLIVILSLLFLVFVILAARNEYIAPSIGMLLSGVVFGLSAGFMPLKTEKGVQALNQCLAFQRFVRMAEKRRIEVLAKDDPTIFGRLLPYAVVLGCADQWAHKFKDLLTAPPEWFNSSGYGSGDWSDVFIYDLGRSMNSMQFALTSPPAPTISGSSGGGGFFGGGGGGGFSGFGGGGFSGGGFGGGGGGSW